MLYDGFIVLDTRESSYDIPGVSSGGGQNQGGCMPSGGGGGGGWQSWINPETIGATLGLVTTAVDAGKKTEDQKALKAVCGPRPLLSKERKKTYQACVDKYMAQQNPAPMPQFTPPPPRMSTGMIILIVVLVLMVLAMFTYLIIKANKAKTA